MEKKEERRFTEAELEQCRKVLEDRGYTASLDLDDSDYGEPDSIVITATGKQAWILCAEG